MYSLLVVDDEKWIRKLIIKLLPVDDLHLSVAGEAEDGEEGLELARRLRPDIVITDIRMPVLSGLEFIERLKKLLPRSEIIIVSGYDNFEYARTAIKYGVRDFLLKPVEEAELRAAVLRAAENIAGRNRAVTEKAALERQVRRLAEERAQEECPECPEIGGGKIREALKYIHARYAEPISLKSICAHLVMNPTYFSELFKKETGVGFSRYLAELRLSTARRLLRDNKELSVADVARVCGFQDPNYFSRIFKLRSGCPPQEYRSSESAPERCGPEQR